MIPATHSTRMNGALRCAALYRTRTYGAASHGRRSHDDPLRPSVKSMIYQAHTPALANITSLYMYINPKPRTYRHHRLC